MQKLIAVLGPTAVGKTDTAIFLAEKFNGELISADSVQVYKGLDIISGKDLPAGRQGLPVSSKFKLQKKDGPYSIGYYLFEHILIYLLDVVKPSYSFNVSDFIAFGQKFLEQILEKEKLPIIVGGTGFYVKGLLDGIDTSPVPIDENLRNKLKNFDVLSLQKFLLKENKKKFDSMNNSDRNNPRRLIRAIEIASKIKNFKLASPAGRLKIKNDERKEYDILMIGLKCEREELKKRIDWRVDKRLKLGAIDEAKVLFKNYEKLSEQVKNANGYRQLFEYLKNEVSLDRAIQKWKIAEYHYSKNQMTWFDADRRIQWFDIGKKDFRKNLVKEVHAWYNKDI